MADESLEYFVKRYLAKETRSTPRNSCFRVTWPTKNTTLTALRLNSGLRETKLAINYHKILVICHYFQEINERFSHCEGEYAVTAVCTASHTNLFSEFAIQFWAGFSTYRLTRRVRNIPLLVRYSLHSLLVTPGLLSGTGNLPQLSFGTILC
jgi:hypothetical protein